MLSGALEVLVDDEAARIADEKATRLAEEVRIATFLVFGNISPGSESNWEAEQLDSESNWMERGM